MNKITLTIVMEPVELREAATILNAMATNIDGITSVSAASDNESDANAVFAASADTGEVVATGDTSTGKITLIDVKPEDYPIMVNGVETDKAGLPYSAEIHTGGNNRIQKKNGLWKYKRGLDEATKIRVEGELRAAIGAPVPNINTTATGNAPAPATGNAPAPATGNAPAPATGNAPAPATGNAPAPGPEIGGLVAETLYVAPDGNNYTAEVLKASGWVDADIEKLEIFVDPTMAAATAGSTTFPELMSMITPALADTINPITSDTVTAALVKVGNANGCHLTALPLLAARPDLVHAVKIELFG